jgi:hypothetical protein
MEVTSLDGGTGRRTGLKMQYWRVSESDKNTLEPAPAFTFTPLLLLTADNGI